MKAKGKVLMMFLQVKIPQNGCCLCKTSETAKTIRNNVFRGKQSNKENNAQNIQSFGSKKKGKIDNLNATGHHER